MIPTAHSPSIFGTIFSIAFAGTRRVQPIPRMREVTATPERSATMRQLRSHRVMETKIRSTQAPTKRSPKRNFERTPT